MLVDSWRRADLVERKTSISNRNANHIWRSNVGNNSNVRGNSGSSRSMGREPLTKPTMYSVQHPIYRTVYSPHGRSRKSDVWPDLSSTSSQIISVWGRQGNKAKASAPTQSDKSAPHFMHPCPVLWDFLETSLSYNSTDNPTSPWHSLHIRGSSVLYPVEPIVHLSERLLQCQNGKTLTVTPWMLVLKPSIPW